MIGFDSSMYSLMNCYHLVTFLILYNIFFYFLKIGDDL